ncbi:AIM14 (YGL160W) [Zygosaccharomyces parabailii]|nr:AIM14 (YGL160W) [Zygosaccharomyces parabailii]CDH11674.1 probable metalloreductase AIM14 [Zygosaccharomyces bailii ISA1307]
MDPELVKRHGNTHYANVAYGYYVLFVTVFYLLFLWVLRMILKPRAAGINSSRKRKLAQQLYLVKPVIHLPILLMAVLLPFYRHYSLSEHPTVYMKRLGRLSYVLLTLNLILNLRPSWILHHTYTYTDLIPLHKWLSRCIVLIAVVHGILFLAYWALGNSNLLGTKLRNPYNLIGFLLFFPVFLLIVCSAAPMRRYSYNAFYLIHNLATFSFIFLTAFHARPGISFPYLVLNTGLLIWHGFAKFHYARHTDVLQKNTDYQNTNLVNIQLPRMVLPDQFEPACHIRVSPYTRLHPLYWLFPSHPFTVASLPSDTAVDLIVAESRHPKSFKFEMGAPYTVINKYDPAIPRLCLESAKRVAIVCGGSGVSFGLPLYRYFKEIRPVEYVQFIWLVKDVYQLKVIDELASVNSLDGSKDCHAFITRIAENDNTAHEAEQDLEFELESMTQGISNEDGTLVNSSNGQPVSNFKFASLNFGRRIDWATDLSQFVEPASIDNTWLLTCGPSSLIESGRQYAADNGIYFASEVYAL